MPGHLQVFERAKKKIIRRKGTKEEDVRERETSSSLLARVKAAFTEAAKGKRVDSALKNIQLSDLQT